ncbi:LysR family transcriptional regulator [Actinopolyspora erythraea]|uniref:LysR family transcriptional regulator n=1 Tax=Actinopolyspora erythraea TaxID=414996 RepID=A0A099D8R9_9ACTN|nr:LysR family transcriptional regulator [Actinopolyspora erythraea]ASU80066.1 LysR family transcriptional regulator [Actinopolyspora erythraea]KGI82202.1 LysR family transcriptional regulator [Actinopolyspora erythraea]
MLDVRRMQVLRAVVNSGSVSAAANNLGYTPSAISQQLSTLEREAGLSLLEKVGRGVRPTSAGMMLAERAGDLSELLSRTETELAKLRAGNSGVLRLRFFQSASVALIPPAVATFRARYPQVRLDLGMQEDGMLERLAEGEADLAVIVVGRETRSVPGVRLLHLVDEPYRVVLPVGHPLCEEDQIDLARLSEESWIQESMSAGPCAESLYDAFAAAGFTPHVALESDSAQSSQGFVAAGMGISLVPRLGLDPVHPGVEVRPLRNPEPARRIHVAVRESLVNAPNTVGLLQALREAART